VLLRESFSSSSSSSYSIGFRTPEGCVDTQRCQVQRGLFGFWIPNGAHRDATRADVPGSRLISHVSAGLAL
jgi:hypothetical protein